MVVAVLLVLVMRRLRISTPRSCTAAQSWVTQRLRRVPASNKSLAS